ncbi:hypothetical protein A0256_16775 [Mucilaginibacter sp. PAMC 26640]|nr:hypothetical protein A0256_16775 [Mucilaginibacter sp. PAMC 26640]
MRLSLTIPVLLVITVCAIATFLFAFSGYPLFVVDSGCFLPVSYFINHGNHLVNPFYDAGIDQVSHRFLFYPPLFPYVVGFINRLLPTDINNLFISLTIIDDLTIIITFLSIYLYLKKTGFLAGKSAYIYFGLLATASFAFQGISTGRPEILSRLLISCFILNNIGWPSTLKYTLNGLLVGLAFITSPISGFYLVFIAAALLSYSNNFTLKPIASTCFGVISVIGIFILVYPYPLAELINGMRIHSANVIFNRNGSDMLQTFIAKYITAPATPLGIVPFVIVCVYIYVYLINRKLTLTFIFSTLLIGTVLYFAFYKDLNMAYNLYVLSPLAIFLIAVIFARNYRSISLLKNLNLVIALILFVNTTGFIRKTVVFFITKEQLVAPGDFRTQLSNIIKQTKPNEKVVVSNGLWPYALGNYEKVILYRTGDMNYILNNVSVKFMLIQQSNSGLLKPKVYPRFKLVKNGFNTDNVKVWHLTLGNTYPGHQTAVYERE